MLPLSTAAIAEKNKLANTGAWLVLIQITLPDTTVLPICSNTVNITWPTVGGQEYVAFPFEMDTLGESAKGEKPQVVIRVGNVTQEMVGYMELANGGVGSEVIIRVVHSAHLDLTDPEIELVFECVDAWADSQWASFVLGAPSPYDKRWPRSRIMKNFCRYKVFKGDRCGFMGDESLYPQAPEEADGIYGCDRTLTRCRVLENSERFGGAPGVGQKGIYVG